MAFLYSRMGMVLHPEPGLKEQLCCEALILGAEEKDQETSEKLSMALRASSQRQHLSLSLILHQTKHVTWLKPPIDGDGNTLSL